ncbi:MAG: response regulator [Paraglaciecola sp.]|nr:response regulator [Paraglaciecola sp.]
MLRVLYVEDNESEVELLLLTIDRYGFASSLLLDVADTVEQAKEMYDIEKHKAVLIDCNLPDGEGVDVAQFIRKKHATLALIFLSASMTNEYLHKAEKYNPKACLEKDYSKEFVEKIIQLID